MATATMSGLTAREAVCEAFRDGGLDLLKQPRRMASLVCDFADESDRTVRVIDQQLNQELLDPLANAAKNDGTQLEDVRAVVAQILHDIRLIEATIAFDVADALVGGLADYLGRHMEPLSPMVASPSGSQNAAGQVVGEVPMQTQILHGPAAPPQAGVGTGRMPSQSAGSAQPYPQPAQPYPQPVPAMQPQNTPRTPTWLVGLVALLAGVFVALVVVLVTGAGTSTDGPSDDVADADQTVADDDGEQEMADEDEENKDDQDGKVDEKSEEDKEDEPTPDPPVFTRANTNTAIPPDGYSNSYGPENVLLDDSTHAWNADYPAGAWIQLDADSEQTVQGFTIINGYSKSKDVYDKNHRPKDITIELSDGYTQSATLEDAFRKEQRIEFDEAHQTTYLKITVNSSYSGWKYDDCCIDRIKAF